MTNGCYMNVFLVKKNLLNQEEMTNNSSLNCSWLNVQCLLYIYPVFDSKGCPRGYSFFLLLFSQQLTTFAYIRTLFVKLRKEMICVPSGR